jgi:threonine 3-dehydrogenase
MTIANIAKTVQTPIFLGGGKIGWEERSVPSPQSGELLLQVKANALCGSDRKQFYDGTEITPGHESTGIVVAAGPNTTTEIGTPGVVFMMEYCGECRNCKLGYTNQCLFNRGDMGFSKNGGYGQYMIVRETIFFPIDADIPLTEATMLLDIMGTGGHAVKRAQLVHNDIQSVLVAGAGPIGLAMLAMAKIMLGNDMPVLITDFVPYRLELAKRLGGIPIHLGEQSLTEGLAANGFQGVDVAIDTSGKTSGRKSSLDVLNYRGVLVCVGHGEELNVKVTTDLIFTERAVLGSEYFQFNELADNLRLLKEHLPYLSQIITHRYGIEDLQFAYELFFKGDTGKVIIEL